MLLSIFAESPWPGMCIFIFTAIVSYLLWDRTGKKVHFVGVACSLCGIFAALMYDSMHITPSEEIEISVNMLAKDCESNNIAKTVAYVDPIASELQEIIRTGMSLVKVDPGLRITDLHVTMQSRPGEAIPSRGTSHFRANGTVTFQGAISSHVASRWNLTWQKANGSWKIIKLERLDPINGKVIATLDHKVN